MLPGDTLCFAIYGDANAPAAAATTLLRGSVVAALRSVRNRSIVTAMAGVALHTSTTAAVHAFLNELRRHVAIDYFVVTGVHDLPPAAWAPGSTHLYVPPCGPSHELLSRPSGMASLGCDVTAASGRTRLHSQHTWHARDSSLPPLDARCD